MERLIIQGGQRLRGEVHISGSKNSTLAILVASALGDGVSIIENVPLDTDVRTMCSILRELGVRVTCREAEGSIEVDGSTISNVRSSYELARQIRASFYTAGMLLARTGEAQVPLPGGCSIGSRPVDFHVKSFKALGASTNIEHGYVNMRAATLTGTRIFIERSSVGATVNTILAASMAEGVTTIDNPAREPEIVDLANYINAMGGSIRGAGTDMIRIRGVRELHGAAHEVIPDRIEAGTFIMAAAITRGEIALVDVVPEHLKMVLNLLQQAGASFEEKGDLLHLKVRGPLDAIDVETAPYPGFPTDLQQPLGVLMSVARGISVIRETIFESRFRYVDELRRMGAEIKIKQDMVIISGVERLTGAPVEALDLRGGAALVLAGLRAEGETEIYGVEHIDRGYENLDRKMRKLGARIRRV